MNEPMGQRAGQDASADLLDPLCRYLVQVATSHDIDGIDSASLLRSLETTTLLDSFPEFFCLKDRRGRFIFANAAVLAFAGSYRLSGVIGRTEFDFLDDEVARERFTLEQQLMSSGENSEREELLRLADGRELWLATTRTCLRDSDGAIAGLMVLSRDITEARRHADLQRGHAGVLEMVARGKPLPLVLDALCQVIEGQLEGISASVLLLDDAGEHLRHGAAPSLPMAYTKLVDGVAIGPRVGSCGTCAWRRAAVVVEDIETDPLWSDFRDLAAVFRLRSCWSTPIMSADGRLLGTFALYSETIRQPTQREMDLTAVAVDLGGIAIERAQNEARIQHMAYHDPLTGLPNRTLFWAQFSRALSEAARESRKVTVAYVDLDNFKGINDSFGHALGDEVLKQLAGRLTHLVRAADLVVRLGGDEFAIVFSHIYQNEASVLKRLREIRSTLSQPVDVDGIEIPITCSMGVAFYPRDGDTPEELLATADRAMYTAKAMGRDALQVSRTPDPAFG
ncbi:diguanylate cyclase (GGDEF)-like protein/PAS domain S-box-containing protein [Neorhizobium galegae]|uniref:sensor domain-containing protein n=1 Tax=Neorhizobium galegae TaxID=399 RepID=UPI001AE2F00D|nr:diguanylate cyclase [Neorhizobium galegae]MBP2547624.1 diguanylate cyclase (GGDEF)-like protein/PAS domain S-box-containing protein [Neorhizobium galegae]